MKPKIESWSDVELGTILYRLPISVSTDFTKVVTSFANQLKISLDTQWKVSGLSTAQKRIGINATPIERRFSVEKSNDYSDRRRQVC